MKINKINPLKILVFTNDAGASAYICSIISNEKKKFNWKVYIIKGSPACKEVKKWKISHKFFLTPQDISKIIKNEKPDLILYGTGWVNFSSIIKRNSKRLNIKTIALIDHWVQYKNRFSKNSLPDAILVMDKRAKQIALKAFNSKVKIFQVKNYYLEKLKFRFFSTKNKVKKFVVFISEPTKVKNDSLDFRKFEYNFLEDILKTFSKVIVRLHPTESKNKYKNLTSKFNKTQMLVVESHKEDLATTLSKSKLTIGIGSTALYFSYKLGIKTISYIPNNYKLPVIPLPNKYNLSNLEDLKKIKFYNLKKKYTSVSGVPFYRIINSYFKRIG